MNRIALFKGRSITSRLIRFQTRSQYSHAAILWPDDRVVEATGAPFPHGRVRLVKSIDTQHTPGTEVDIFGVDADLHTLEAGNWLLQRVGRPYDYRSVARFLTRKPAEQNGRWFCSELVFAFYQAGGVDLLHGVQAHDVSPRDLSLSPYLRHLDTRTTV